MANTKSAAKRARQTIVRTQRNRAIVSGVKNQQKRVRAAIAGGKKDVALAESIKLASVLDKAAKRGAIHSNAASRQKSRITKAVVALA
jgi:small subunit ribosomal protein S20